MTGLVSRYAPPWVMLQWDWPGDAEAVRVCWTWDRHPLEPLEPGLCTDDVLRSRYEKDGCFKLRSDLRRPHFFGVFARPKVGEARFGPGAQVVEPTGTSIDIPYEVVVKKRFLRWGACQKVTVRLRRANSDEPEYLSGLSLIGRAGAVPVDLHGGSPVLEDCFAIFDEDGVAELEVAERFWNPKVFVRLFFREPPPTTSGARPIRLLPAAVDRLRLGA